MYFENFDANRERFRVEFEAIHEFGNFRVLREAEGWEGSRQSLELRIRGGRASELRLEWIPVAICTDGQ